MGIAQLNGKCLRNLPVAELFEICKFDDLAAGEVCDIYLFELLAFPGEGGGSCVDREVAEHAQEGKFGSPQLLRRKHSVDPAFKLLDEGGH